MKINPRDQSSYRSPVSSDPNKLDKLEEGAKQPSKRKQITISILEAIKRPFKKKDTQEKATKKIEVKNKQVDLEKLNHEITEIDKVFKKVFFSETTLDSYSETSLEQLKTEREKLEYYDKKLQDIKKFIEDHIEPFAEIDNARKVQILINKVQEIESDSKTARAMLSETISQRFEPREVIAIKVKRGVSGFFQSKKSIEEKFDGIINNLVERVTILNKIDVNKISSIAHLESIVEEGDQAFKQIQILKGCLKEFQEKYPDNEKVKNFNDSLLSLECKLNPIRTNHPRKLQELKNRELVNVTSIQMLKQAEHITELSNDATTFDQLIDLRAALDQFENNFEKKVSSGFFKDFFGDLKTVLQKALTEARTTLENHPFLREDEARVFLAVSDKCVELNQELKEFERLEQRNNFDDKLSSLDQKLREGVALKKTLEDYINEKKLPNDKREFFQNVQLEIESIINSIKEKIALTEIEKKYEELAIKSMNFLNSSIINLSISSNLSDENEWGLRNLFFEDEDNKWIVGRAKSFEEEGKDLLKEIAQFLNQLSPQRDEKIITGLQLTRNAIEKNLQERDITTFLDVLSYSVNNLLTEKDIILTEKDTILWPEDSSKIFLLSEEIVSLQGVLEKLFKEGSFLEDDYNSNLNKLNKIKKSFNQKIGLEIDELRKRIQDYEKALLELKGLLNKVKNTGDKNDMAFRASLIKLAEKRLKDISTDIDWIQNLKTKQIVHKDFHKDFFEDFETNLSHLRSEFETICKTLRIHLAEEKSVEELFILSDKIEVILSMLKENKWSSHDSRYIGAVKEINKYFGEIDNILNGYRNSEKNQINLFKERLEPITKKFKEIVPLDKQTSEEFSRIQIASNQISKILEQAASALKNEEAVISSGLIFEVKKQEKEIENSLAVLDKILQKNLTYHEKKKISGLKNKLLLTLVFSQYLSSEFDSHINEKGDESLRVIAALKKELEKLSKWKTINPNEAIRIAEKMKFTIETENTKFKKYEAVFLDKSRAIREISGKIEAEINSITPDAIQAQEKKQRYQSTIKGLVEQFTKLNKMHEELKKVKTDRPPSELMRESNALTNQINNLKVAIKALDLPEKPEEGIEKTYVDYARKIEESVGLIEKNFESQFKLNIEEFFIRHLNEIQKLEISKDYRGMFDRITIRLNEVKNIRREIEINNKNKNEGKEFNPFLEGLSGPDKFLSLALSGVKENFEIMYVKNLAEFLSYIEKTLPETQASLERGVQFSDEVSIRDMSQLVEEINTLFQILEAGSDIQGLVNSKENEYLSLKEKYSRIKGDIQILTKTYFIEREFSEQGETRVEIGTKLVAREIYPIKEAEKTLTEITEEWGKFFQRCQEKNILVFESKMSDSEDQDVVAALEEADVLLLRCTNAINDYKRLDSGDVRSEKLVEEIESLKNLLLDVKIALQSKKTREALKTDISNQVADFLAPYLSGKVSLKTPAEQKKERERESLESVVIDTVLKSGKFDVDRKQITEIAVNAFINEGVKNIYRIFLQEKAVYSEISVKLSANSRLSDNSQGDLFQTFLERLYAGVRRDFPEFAKTVTKKDVDGMAMNILQDIEKELSKVNATGRRGFM